jgi:predicted ATP-dependent serine protease
MWSSYKEKPLVKNAVYVGEVSLLGEVKKVKNWEKRKKEAEAMGRKIVEIKNVREIKNG